MCLLLTHWKKNTVYISVLDISVNKEAKPFIQEVLANMV